MTTQPKAGDPVEKLYLEIRLKTKIIAGELAGIIVPVPVSSVIIPSMNVMHQAAMAAIEQIIQQEGS